VVLAIGSEDRMASLDEVQTGLQRLAAADGPEAELEELVTTLPVVTALMHGVHGNEISSSGAAMAEAYHLLAATGDPTVDDRPDRPGREPRRPCALRPAHHDVARPVAERRGLLRRA
jgi:hypothetical protein